MANAALMFDNLADADATMITASSSITLAPPTTLQDPHVARKWRGSAGSSEYILIDLGAVVDLDTVALMGCSGLFGDAERNLSSTAATQLRVSAVDSSALAAEIYDSNSAIGRIDEAYGLLLFLLPTVVSGRYVRIDISEGGATYLEAGRVAIGERQQVAINFQPGWSRRWVDRSTKIESRGGQTYINVNNSYRALELTFDFMSAAERNGFVEDIDRINGGHTDVLVITDPDSTNLGRDCLWGLIDENSPVIAPYAFDAFTKAYKFRERL